MAVTQSSPLLVRHEGEAPHERSTCGWRHLLVSRQDENVAAWAHAVDIDGAREHYHRRATELYYVLEGEGTVLLDGVEHPVRKGSLVHIPPGVVHGARGRMPGDHEAASRQSVRSSARRSTRFIARAPSLPKARSVA